MTKIYGISKIQKHPQGWSYIVAFLDKHKRLSKSKLLCAWWDDTKEELRDEFEHDLKRKMERRII